VVQVFIQDVGVSNLLYFAKFQGRLWDHRGLKFFEFNFHGNNTLLYVVYNKIDFSTMGGTVKIDAVIFFSMF
jgi:hypothetical protein